MHSRRRCCSCSCRPPRSPGGRRSTAPEASRWWRPSPPSCTGGALGGPWLWRCTCWARRPRRLSFGAALGLIGGLLEAPWGRAGALAVAVVALVYALGELPRVTATVPQLRRQVPDWWREFFSWPLAATLYGAGLGVGFLTYVSHGTLVAVAVAALATGDPVVGALIVAPFGLVRGLSAARSATVHTQQDSQRLVDHLAGTPDRGRSVANGLVLVLVTALAVALAVRSTDGWASFATAGLALAFAWAATSKAVDVAGWRRTLDAHGLPRGVATTASFAVPAAEAARPAARRRGGHQGGGRVGARAAGHVHGRGAARVASLRPPGAVRMLRGPRRDLPRRPARAQHGARGARARRGAASATRGRARLARMACGRRVPADGVGLAGLAVAGCTAWAAIRWLGRGARV